MGCFYTSWGFNCAIDVAAELRIKYTIPKVCTAHAQGFAAYSQYEVVLAIFGLAVVYLAALYVDTVFHDLDKNHLRFCALTFLFKNLTFLGKKQYNT